jgi:channel protein (hemolysin III family)
MNEQACEAEVSKRISKYSLREELGNVLTHALATGLIGWGLAGAHDPLYQLLSFAIGLTFFLSTLYHGCALLNLKKSIVERFRMLDIASIYISAGATGLAWGLKVGTSPYILLSCLLPIIISFFWVVQNYGTDQFEKANTPLAVMSGGLTIIMFYSGHWTTEEILFFSGGILFYTAGTGFYISKDKEWSHTVWHCLVGLAAGIHLFGIGI